MNTLGRSTAFKPHLCAIRTVKISQNEQKSELCVLRYYDVITVKYRCLSTEMSQITLIGCLSTNLTRLLSRKPYVEKRDFDKLFLTVAIMTSS